MDIVGYCSLSRFIAGLESIGQQPRYVIEYETIGVTGLQLTDALGVGRQVLSPPNPGRQAVVDGNQSLGYVDGFKVWEGIVLVQGPNNARLALEDRC